MIYKARNEIKHAISLNAQFTTPKIGFTPFDLNYEWIFPEKVFPCPFHRDDFPALNPQT